MAQTFFPLGPKNHHTDLLFTRFANRAAESLCDLGKPFRQPAFSPTVGRTRVDPDDHIRGGQSPLRKSPRHRLFLFRKDNEFRCRGIACEAQWLQQIPIIADLVDKHAAIGHSDWIGQ